MTPHERDPEIEKKRRNLAAFLTCHGCERRVMREALKWDYETETWCCEECMVKRLEHQFRWEE